MFITLTVMQHLNECFISGNVTFAHILLYYGILNYSLLIEILNLVICYTLWTLGVMLYSGKCGTAVTSINGGFLAP